MSRFVRLVLFCPLPLFFACRTQLHTRPFFLTSPVPVPTRSGEADRVGIETRRIAWLLYRNKKEKQWVDLALSGEWKKAGAGWLQIESPDCITLNNSGLALYLDGKQREAEELLFRAVQGCPDLDPIRTNLRTLIASEGFKTPHYRMEIRK